MQWRQVERNSIVAVTFVLLLGATIVVKSLNVTVFLSTNFQKSKIGKFVIKLQWISVYLDLFWSQVWRQLELACFRISSLMLLNWNSITQLLYFPYTNGITMTKMLRTSRDCWHSLIQKGWLMLVFSFANLNQKQWPTTTVLITMSMCQCNFGPHNSVFFTIVVQTSCLIYFPNLCWFVERVCFML